MRRPMLLAGVIVLLLATIDAQERVTLTVPEAAASNTAYRIDRVTLIADDPDTPAADGFIHIQLTGLDRPNQVICSYTPATSPTGTALLNGLNKANLSTAYAGNATTGSLKQRILHRLVIMGESAAVCSQPVAGSVSGTPE